MSIRHQSSVLITRNIVEMKDFYTNVLGQKVQFDFGGSVIFECGLTLWRLKDSYPLAKALSSNLSDFTNNNMELCFKTDDFIKKAAKIKQRAYNSCMTLLSRYGGKRLSGFSTPGRQHR